MGVFLILGIVLTSVNWNDAFYISNNELPCEFQDSVNITDGHLESDDSIMYDGTKYPKKNFAQVNYIEANGSKHVIVNPHLRGCPCNIRPCIRLCCPIGTFVNISRLKRGSNLQQIPCYNHPAANNYELNVYEPNNQSNVLKLDEHFSYAELLSPIKFYKLRHFKITTTGQILHKNRSLTHREYCLSTELNHTSNSVEFVLFVYFKQNEELPAKYILSAICMLVSVFFITATIFVYIILPELHNLHGSCLVCHLAGLIVAYLLTAWIKLNGWHYIDSILCNLCGHLMYFSLLSAFLWSNVITYDLWRNFRATHMFRQFSDKHTFRFYMLYAWGISMFLTFTVSILNFTRPFPNYLLPIFNIHECFLRKESLLLYFYMPLFIIFSVNIIYFTSTTLKICQIQRELIKMTSQEESARHQSDLNNGKDDLTLYVRLFVITGVTWIMEGISFIISPENNDWFFRIFDIWNALQGLIIFISYIMKRRVLNLIRKRFQDFFIKKARTESFSLNSSMNKSTNMRLSLSSTDKLKYKEIR